MKIVLTFFLTLFAVTTVFSLISLFYFGAYWFGGFEYRLAFIIAMGFFAVNTVVNCAVCGVLTVTRLIRQLSQLTLKLMLFISILLLVNSVGTALTLVIKTGGNWAWPDDGLVAVVSASVLSAILYVVAIYRMYSVLVSRQPAA